jgi:4-aminobutyrate aminotransferase
MRKLSRKAMNILRRDGNAIGRASCPRQLIAPYPLVVEETKGAIIRDVDGNEYIDFSAQGAVAGTGYCHPTVLDAIEKQVRKTTAIGLWSCSNSVSVELAEKLIEITPGKFKKKVIFGHSGSDACDGVYKLVPLYTKRPRIVSFLGGFHGSTMGAYSLSGVKGLSKILGFPNVVKVPYPYCYRCPFHLEYPDCGTYCVDFIEDQIFTTICPPEDTSALIIEPIISDGGEIVPPDGYLKKLKRLCEQYNLLFIADEVKHGFGRTGRMFAIEHENVEPDITVLGKSIASGMPLSACVGPAEMMDIMGAHAFTLAGHTVSCAAALASIRVILAEKLTENAEKLGSKMKERLEEMKEEHELMGDVRGKGLIIGVELVKNGESKEPAPMEALKVCHRAWELGLITICVGIHANVVEITPPLVLTKEQAEKGLNMLEEAIRDVEAGKVPNEKIT